VTQFSLLISTSAATQFWAADFMIGSDAVFAVDFCIGNNTVLAADFCIGSDAVSVKKIKIN
jgi:hypothetical protein